MGSYLVEQLLNNGIQVIGVDNLSTGQKENLSEVFNERRFSFYQEITEELLTNTSRLDYAYLLLDEDQSSAEFSGLFDQFIQASVKFKSKVLLVSSIKLYDSHNQEETNLVQAEKKLTEIAKEEKLNFRIVRLASVYGPRMEFGQQDPLERLLKAALLKQLPEEEVPLDFTTRSLFVDDAVSLLLKAMMHGGTSHKIYDGVLALPIKLSEIKQVLTDPLWHESINFHPTELPSWPTPNLELTQKELHWQTKTPLIKGIKETMHYFASRPELLEVKEEVKDNQEPKAEESEAEEVKERVWIETGDNPKKQQGLDLKIAPDWSEIKSRTENILRMLGIIFGLGLIFYAIVWPVGNSMWSIANLDNNLQRSQNSLMENDYTKAESYLAKAEQGVGELKKVKKTTSLLSAILPLKPIGESETLVVEGVESLVSGVKEEVLGAEAFNLAVRAMAGEQGELKELLSESQSHFRQSQQLLAQASTAWDQIPSNRITSMIQGMIDNWREEGSRNQQSATKSLTFSRVLERWTQLPGKASLLVVLQDNASLRPTGGMIRAVAVITFEEGKFLSIESYSVEDADKKLVDKLEPPTELKTDFNLSKWSLQYANNEPDFAQSVKMINWFVFKELGVPVQAAIALDVEAIGEILQQTGAVNLPSNGASYDQKRLWEDYLTMTNNQIWSEILKQTLLKLFFLPKMSGPSLGQVLDQNLAEKHLLVYLSDPLGQNLVSMMGWSGSFPKASTEEQGEREEIVALVSNNLLNNFSDSFLQKTISLQTTLSADNYLTNHLKIVFTNQYSGGSTFAGSAKNRFKIYLRSGSKLTKATWGDEDVLKEVGSFSDYGRAGYSIVLEIPSQQEKVLDLTFTNLQPLTWNQEKAKYSLTVYKQPGTKKDSFSYELNIPSGLKVQSSDLKPETLGVYSVQESINQDLRYTILLQK